MQNKLYTFSSVAKINRFLHITGQRANGYHELQSVFQFLNYGDTLHFRPNQSGEIALTTPIDGVDHEQNLIVKAARALKQHTVSSVGVDISIDKRLPMGGGLGGGSSNAATTLLALNKLWQLNLSQRALIDIGVTLGADVPVFIYGETVFAQGIGELLTPYKTDTPWFLVTIPDVSISTATVFQHPELPRNHQPLNINDFDIEQCVNDCEPLVRKLYPEVEKLLAWLLEYAPSRLTGTGACIFTRFDSQAEALRLQDKLPPGVKSFVAQGLDRSPILDELEQH
ncbi:4-(cytidine 5'-diphospho)-2-C-methyl-D-erythritol kinase [Thalassotalea ponticola]|uniref:4-(cytidine 5'-diphospho)-2-C-methyl-D-erythritol kinase n=1 Tax=Thalassotalea ponticola TaxID=1523392 RepID=UPI0025B55169|nr:4-(cytidine 5'-diphospho)-2-C-methyl-D-erythritol kinase [Thalassotalea ponticola]MDN3651571.1 4-(cytidine 5'-diphospho)-2-C-methyl-D-erythritol kinase [Thalassotalea ponticola]